MTTAQPEVIVVGAGVAGLVAAWRVAKGGRTVCVLERSSFIGGMASSIEVAGQRVDLGSHRLHPSIAPDLFAAIQALLGNDLQLRQRNGRLRLRDRWVRFPLRGTDLVRQMPRPLAARAAADACLRSLRRPKEDTFAEVVCLSVRSQHPRRVLRALRAKAMGYQCLAALR